MQLNQNELYAALGLAMQKIEAAGASVELTRAVVIVGDIRRAVGNRYNPSDEYAAASVRKEIAHEKPAALTDAARLNWLEEQNGRLQFDAEDDASLPHAVVFLPTLENGESTWREAGRGDDFREAIDDAMGQNARLANNGGLPRA